MSFGTSNPFQSLKQGRFVNIPKTAAKSTFTVIQRDDKDCSGFMNLKAYSVKWGVEEGNTAPVLGVIKL